MKTWFHIGYPKAGSSMLQKHFFARHPQINFLGRIPTSNSGLSSKNPNEGPFFDIPELKPFHDDLVGNSFDPKKSKTTLDEVIKQTFNPETHKINLLSSEFVTSVFFSYPDISEKIHRLKRIGVSGVILVLRNQMDLISSIYREHPFHPSDLVHGKPVSIDQWIREADTLPFSYLESLNFYETIQTCTAAFGKENVHLMLFEKLVSSPEAMLEKFAVKMGLNPELSINIMNQPHVENRGVSSRYNTIRNLKKKLLGEFPISRYLPDAFLAMTKSILKKGKKAQYPLKPDTISFINNYFRDSNSKLKGVDLETLNYPPYYQN